jgi:2-dehydropantoate 2-reductase
MGREQIFSPKKFAVVGAGPVGCIVAAFLSKGGYDVTLCDVMLNLLEPAIDPGIKIEGSENIEQPVSRICTSVDDLAQYDPEVIFITAKANTLPLIASAIESFYKEGMYIISWQNGIDTELELAKILGRTPIMRAVVNFGCGLVGPAHVNMPFHHPPHYLQELVPESTHAAIAVADILTRCGLGTERTDQIVSMVWRKSILNACMNPVCAVTGLTMAQTMNDPIIFQIVDALIKECVKIARANEISLEWDFYSYAINYMKKAGNHKPSMLVDVENNRRTEIDFINGKFVNYGKQAGIETPYNNTLRSLVKGVESRPK